MKVPVFIQQNSDGWTGMLSSLHLHRCMTLSVMLALARSVSDRDKHRTKQRKISKQP